MVWGTIRSKRNLKKIEGNFELGFEGARADNHNICDSRFDRHRAVLRKIAKPILQMERQIRVVFKQIHCRLLRGVRLS